MEFLPTMHLFLFDAPKKPGETKSKSDDGGNDPYHKKLRFGNGIGPRKQKHGDSEKNQCDGLIVFHGLLLFYAVFLHISDHIIVCIIKFVNMECKINKNKKRRRISGGAGVIFA